MRTLLLCVTAIACSPPATLPMDHTGPPSLTVFAEQTAALADRVRLAAESGVADDRLERLLGLSNLVRVNGVGPAFAVYLLDAGIRGPADFLGQDLQQMVDDYAMQVPDGPRLRIQDLEFVQRYCTALAEEIEW